MNKYLIKSAVALALCLSTATRPIFGLDALGELGELLANARWSIKNIQMGPNNSCSICDDFGCTVTQTDSKGHQTQHYYPHARNGSTISQGQIFIDQSFNNTGVFANYGVITHHQDGKTTYVGPDSIAGFE
jgi:hypothetical protein